MKKSIISAIIFGAVGAGIAAYKATKKEGKADILLDKEEIQSVALDIFQREAAEGYRLAVFDEIPEALKKVLFGDSNVAEEGFKLADGVCGLTDSKSKTIYIFVDSLVKCRELIDKSGIGDKVTNIKIVESTVLHECRHSHQFSEMEKQGIDADAVFAYECKQGYGNGLMEKDAVEYSKSPKLYGFFMRPSIVAKSLAWYAGVM